MLRACSAGLPDTATTAGSSAHRRSSRPATLGDTVASSYAGTISDSVPSTSVNSPSGRCSTTRSSRSILSHSLGGSLTPVEPQRAVTSLSDGC